MGTWHAQWATTATRPDAWTTAYVAADPLLGRMVSHPWRTWLLGRTPALPLPPLVVTDVAAAVTGGEQTVRFVVHPRVDGDSIDLATSDHVRRASVDAEELPHDAGGGGWSTTYANAGRKGVVFALTLRGVEPFTMTIVDRGLGLPEVPGMPARRAWSVTQHDGDQTAVQLELTLRPSGTPHPLR